MERTAKGQVQYWPQRYGMYQRSVPLYWNGIGQTNRGAQAVGSRLRPRLPTELVQSRQNCKERGRVVGRDQGK